MVRVYGIKVLTSLILNDMIKVKGHVSEMARCIVDENERIAALAKKFFQELSKKVIHPKWIVGHSRNRETRFKYQTLTSSRIGCLVVFLCAFDKLRHTGVACRVGGGFAVLRIPYFMPEH